MKEEVRDDEEMEEGKAICTGAIDGAGGQMLDKCCNGVHYTLILVQQNPNVDMEG